MIGLSVFKLGNMAGLSEEANALLSRGLAKVPFAAMAFGGYALYCDAELIKTLKESGASQERIDKAIAATAMDSISTVCFTAAPFAGPFSSALIALGSLANFVRGFLSDTPSANPSSAEILVDIWSMGALPLFRIWLPTVLTLRITTPGMRVIEAQSQASLLQVRTALSSWASAAPILPTTTVIQRQPLWRRWQ